MAAVDRPSADHLTSPCVRFTVACLSLASNEVGWQRRGCEEGLLTRPAGSSALHTAAATAQKMWSVAVSATASATEHALCARPLGLAWRPVALTARQQPRVFALSVVHAPRGLQLRPRQLSTLTAPLRHSPASPSPRCVAPMPSSCLIAFRPPLLLLSPLLYSRIR